MAADRYKLTENLGRSYKAMIYQQYKSISEKAKNLFSERSVKGISVKSLFTESVVDMGSVSDGDFSGIYTPSSTLTEALDNSIQVYDAEKAQVYDERHYYPEGQRILINNFLKQYPIDNIGLVLDVGSGSGNSVTSELEIFNSSTIVATDVSPHLLKILKNRFSDNPTNSERLIISCVDIQQDLFKENIFDLAIGAAILHHLMDPKKAVLSTLRSVRKGGAAVFFEPFEYGCTILRIIHSMIFKENEQRPANQQISKRIMDFLLAVDNDYVHRSSVCAGEKEITKILDDKWLFSRAFFEGIAEEAGVDKIIIYSNHSSALDTVFEDYVAQNLWLGLGEQKDVLPEWAWDITRAVDSIITNEMKSDFLIEGTVILVKGSN